MTDRSAAAPPEWRAAGTDFSERRRSGVSVGPMRQIAPTPEMRAIVAAPDGGLVIGANVTIAALATDPDVAGGYPGLALAAKGLATPQIRTLATVGGNLAQRTRCWYYRNPHLSCLKKGGTSCPARSGNHRYGVAFDLGPCVAPHPSTLAAALLAYDAQVETSAGRRDIAALMGDGTDGTRDNGLGPGELITTIRLQPPAKGERASYRRAISRSHAEWPLAELVARVVFDGDRIADVALAAGGVAPIPRRLSAAETSLHGKRLDPATILAAGQAARAGATPLRDTGYKLALLEGLVLDALEQVSVPI